MASSYDLRLVRYNKYGKVQLSSAPRYNFSNPGFGGGIKLYHVFVPVIDMERKKEQNVEVKVAGELSGKGFDEVATTSASQDLKPLDKNKIKEMLHFPVKVSEDTFEKLKGDGLDKISKSSPLNSGAQKRTKMNSGPEKRAKVEDHFDFQ
jgi:hypothetical protein